MKSIIIFFYQYVTSDDVIVGICGLGDHKGSPLRIKSHQMDIVTILHSALTMTRTSALTMTRTSALIMTRTSALIMTRTSVRLYVEQCHISSDKPIRCISQQLCITNYEL